MESYQWLLNSWQLSLVVSHEECHHPILFARDIPALFRHDIFTYLICFTSKYGTCLINDRKYLHAADFRLAGLPKDFTPKSKTNIYSRIKE